MSGLGDSRSGIHLLRSDGGQSKVPVFFCFSCRKQFYIFSRFLMWWVLERTKI